MDIKIKAVEGKMLLDPRTIGGQQRRYGYERKLEGEKVTLGRKEPRVRFSFVGGEFVVTETPDHYFRRAIHAGDIDYVAHVNADGSTKRDPSLVAVSARNVAARAKDAELAAKQAEQAEADEAAALEAAESGEDV